MTSQLSFHDTDPKLWFALSLAFKVKSGKRDPKVKWVKVSTEDTEITFFGPRK